MANPTNKVYTAASIGLTASAFVALVVPVDANFYLLKNTGPDACYTRSDVADASTEDSIAAAAMESLIGGHGVPFGRRARYHAGDTLYFVKCTGPLIGKFWS